MPKPQSPAKFSTVQTLHIEAEVSGTTLEVILNEKSARISLVNDLQNMSITLTSSEFRGLIKLLETNKHLLPNPQSSNYPSILSDMEKANASQQ